VSAEIGVPLATVCRVTGAPRSTIYHRRSRGEALGCRPGPATEVSDGGGFSIILDATKERVVTLEPLKGSAIRS